MIRLSYSPFILVSICFLASSCNSNEHRNEIFIKSMTEDLKNSNKIIQQSAMATFYELEQKQFESVSSARAAIWLPKASHVKQLAERAIAVIQAARIELQKKISAGEKNDLIMQDFLANKAPMILDSLIHFRKSVVRVDTLIGLDYKESGVFKYDLDQIDSSVSFKKRFFESSNPKESILLLHHFENEVWLLANQMIQFANEKTISLHERGLFDVFSAIVSQSSSVIRKGEAIEIMAGVGAFSKSANPSFIIDGKRIKMNNECIAVHMLPKVTITGRHKILVAIEFTNEEGQKREIKKTVEYTVVD